MKPPRFGFRTVISIVPMAILALTMISIGLIVHRGNVMTAEESVLGLFDQIGNRVVADIQGRMGLALAISREQSSQIALSGPVRDGTVENSAFTVLRTMIHLSGDLYSVYAGYDDGSYVQVIAVRRSASVISNLKAPEGTFEARRVILPDGDSLVQRWWFLSEDGKILGQRDDRPVSYDPRKRPWYAASKAAPNIAVLSDPYVFSSQPKPGLTISQALQSGNGVVGVDVSFDQLNALAGSQHVSDQGTVILTDSHNKVLGAAESVRGTSPPLAPLAELTHPLAIAAAHPAADHSLHSEQSGYLLRSYSWKSGNGEVVAHVVAPMDDFIGPVLRMDRQLLFIIAFVLGIGGWIAFWLPGPVIHAITALAEDAEAIKEMCLDGELPPPPPIRELHSLMAAFRMMKRHILERTASLHAFNETLSRMVNDSVVAANGVSTEAQRLAETAQDLNQATAAQADTSRRSAPAIADIAASVRRTTDNATKCEALARRTADHANACGNAVHTAVDAVKNISGKIQVVREIARQTDLLALNAAVEAARAGTYGRGFGVVAAEVRKLAERCEIAAAEICALASDTLQHSQSAGRQLSDLLPEIAQTSDLIGDISESCRHLDNSATEIADLVQKLDKITQRNAVVSGRVSESSEVLAEQARKLTETMSSVQQN